MGDRRPEDFYAATNEEVIPKLNAFVRYVAEWVATEFPGFTRRSTKTGQILIEEENERRFTGAFFVSVLGATRVRFSPGTVNGRVPVIAGRFIDGIDAEGDAYIEGVPTLDVREGPGDRRRSYVGIEVQIDAATGAMDEADPEALQMVHRQNLPAGFSEGGAPDEVARGFHPVAQLTWAADGRRIERVRQWVYFDQTHRYAPGEEGTRGRHWFRPAG
jgi:hypothetical protein